MIEIEVPRASRPLLTCPIRAYPVARHRFATDEMPANDLDGRLMVEPAVPDVAGMHHGDGTEVAGVQASGLHGEGSVGGGLGEATRHARGSEQGAPWATADQQMMIVNRDRRPGRIVGRSVRLTVPDDGDTVIGDVGERGHGRLVRSERLQDRHVSRRARVEQTPAVQAAPDPQMELTLGRDGDGHHQHMRDSSAASLVEDGERRWRIAIDDGMADPPTGPCRESVSEVGQLLGSAPSVGRPPEQHDTMQ